MVVCVFVVVHGLYYQMNRASRVYLSGETFAVPDSFSPECLPIASTPAHETMNADLVPHLEKIFAPISRSQWLLVFRP